MAGGSGILAAKRGSASAFPHHARRVALVFTGAEVAFHERLYSNGLEKNCLSPPLRHKFRSRSLAAIGAVLV